MIYIDPPYNTGKDFIYRDKFNTTTKEYLEETEQTDEDDNLYTTNTEQSGKYHTNWLNMIYPRLKLAHNLLKDDGVIFISIDDNEQANLKKVCDEIFGEDNFVDSICWKKKYGGGAKEKYLVSVHEYILVYAKNKSLLSEFFIDFDLEKARKFYRFKDDKFEKRGYYRTHPLEAVKSVDVRSNLNFHIDAPDDTKISPKRQWRWSKERYLEALQKDEIIFNKNKDNEWVISTKQYLNDENGKQRKTKPQSLIDDIFTQEGTKEINILLSDTKVFSFPKPINLLKKIINIAGLKNDSIILDFFAGSGTTADAVMQLNAEDGGNRRCISVQISEKINEKINKEAFDFCTENNFKPVISSITKERIRRAGEKIIKDNEESKEPKDLSNLDIGFKSYKLTTSNFKKWDEKSTEELSEQGLLKQIHYSIQNIKPTRSQDDILAELMVKFGIPLTSKIEELTLANKKVFSLGVSYLLVCLEKDLTKELAEQLATHHKKHRTEEITEQCRIVVLDNNFNSDQEKANFNQTLKDQQIFEVYSF